MQKMQRAENAANNLILGKFLPEKAVTTMQTLKDQMSLAVTLFPVGSEGGRALPEVWSMNDDFVALATQFIVDVDAAAAAIPAGQNAFTLAWQPVAAACPSCHSAFRSGPIN